MASIETCGGMLQTLFFRPVHVTSGEAASLVRKLTHEVCSAEIVEAPVVSVCLVTFNHARFIRDALDGVLAQEGDVSYEIVVGDDCSTDGTADIVLRYRERYPDRIRVLLARENLGRWTGNGRLNYVRTLSACRGPYVAYLEGDDCWTHPHKLRRQLDLLEARRDLSMCFHAAEAIDEVTGVRGAYAHFDKLEYSLADLAQTNPIPTASVVARRELLSPLPEIILDAPVGDWVLHALCARRGGIGFLDGVWATYRVHSESISQARRDSAARDAEVHRRMCELLADYVGPDERGPFDAWGVRWGVEVAVRRVREGEPRALAALAHAWSRRGRLPEPFAPLLLRSIVRSSPALTRCHRRVSTAWHGLRRRAGHASG